MQPITASIFLLSLCMSAADASNILGIFTSNGRSHLIIHMATVKALVEKGHNVTVVTSLPLKDSNGSFHHIYVPPTEEDDADYRQIISDAATGSNNFDSLRQLTAANVKRVRMQDKALRHPRFQELLHNKGNQFDVVILGLIFNTFQLGVAAHFKCPAIVSWINVPTENVLSLVGNPVAVASVPSMFVTSGHPMDFLNRFESFLLSGVMTAIEQFSEIKMAEYYEEHFSAERYPSYEEVKKNVSLVFCSTHFSEGLIRPMVPGFIEIGGIHVKEKPDPLPKDIQEFLNTADEGFILFTLGTNIKSTDFSAETTLALFNVLSNLKQKVLWKWDSSVTPGLSSNIMFRKWLPQDDLLAHPKLQLFITHAGRASVTEAQYHGIPMLAMPMYGDQFAISRRIEAMGFGLVVNYRNITEEGFKNQLEEVLTNTRYLEAVLKFSMLYRDRPMTPKQSVVYWTEYVIRHRGARHIQSPVVHLNFFQRNSLDVIGCLTLFLYVGFIILSGVLKIVYILAKTLLSLRRKLKNE